MIGRKFFKTKLCKLYQNGRCPRQTCSFAHGLAELRRSPPPPGRRDYRSGDLRDRLERRHSPYRRYSLERDGRGHQAFHGQRPTSRDRRHSISRSPPRHREGKHRKQLSLGARSDDSASYKTKSDAEDIGKDDKSLLDDGKDEVEEELKHLQWDIQKLEDEKVKLKKTLEDKDDEANKLSSRIKDLETRLAGEQEDCKRVTSKIKKFLKAHGRYLKAQEELKRSQARFQGIFNELGLDILKPSTNEDDSSINFFSEEDANADHRTSGREDELQNNTSSVKKRPREYLVMSDERKTGGLSKKGRIYDVTTRAEKLVRSEEPLRRAENSSKNMEELKEISVRKGDLKSMVGENKHKQAKLTPPTPVRKVKGAEAGHLLPPTSMAAHAVDELIEFDEKLDIDDGTLDDRPKLSFIPPLPPRNTGNAYRQYEGEDEDVDVEKADSGMVDRDSDVDI